MPTGSYHGITVREDVYANLEKLRTRLALRSIAEVVEHLATRALKEAREVPAR